MLPTSAEELPADVTVGRHPDYGIVAANPKHLAAGTWMLERLDFRPVLGEPTLYALTDQQRDGQGRATRAVALLRNAGFRVDTDAVFNPSLVPDAGPVPSRAPLGEPDVAFAEHPRLGIVAAIDGRASGFTGLALLDHGWRHDPRLDIYTLPAATGRDEALGKVAAATLALHRSGTQVAVQPRLAHDVAARRPAPAPTSSHDRIQDAGVHSSPISAAALAASPALAGLAGKAPVPAPATSAAAARPIDPRIAFSRDR
ncbi:hypothetical protein AQF52_7045 [Streptomyces venezuelae]|uniref:hypothetical protein n=1 Tax=Streptomyces gardneri TaxID=66892 RepID=UPI0006BD4E68|nr:hypothetical protein [Streptomyces gardneri]ALO12631.1 hypothetical protein AQF52_7045 [Streptomyces venezuelae]WRK40894.1 hypothetical protein U0M97_35570 [Streptomyces venezuelae]CUM36731.1 FIG01130464: hypothetical protein [Streptomyces venezuelae]